MLLVSVVIGQNNCFCFAITTLKKTALTRDSNLLTDSKEIIKGTMSSLVHALVVRNHFEIVGLTFSNTVREFRRLLYRIGCKCKRISTDFERFSIF